MIPIVISEYCGYPVYDTYHITHIYLITYTYNIYIQMFTSMKECEKQLNTLNPAQKIKHIDNTLNELKVFYYYYSDIQMLLIWLIF